MRFSLKYLLIAMGAVGATIGLMTRLLLNEPESFIAILRLVATVGPFVLGVGTIIWIGIYGAQSGRKLVIWGGALLVAPVLTMAALQAFLPSGNPLRLLTTQRLIANRLPNQVDQPWVWQELERRLATGSLTNVEVDSAVAKLTAHMKRTQPAGWDQPLSWQHDFIHQIRQQNMISEPVYVDLCDAFYGTDPKVTLINPPVVEGDAQFNLQIEFGNPWSDLSGLAITPAWDCKQILLNGKPINVRRFDKHFGRQAMVVVEAPLHVGENILEVEYECAFIDDGRLVGVNLDKLTAAQWPKTRKRWTSKVTVPIQIAPSPNSDTPK